jgi:NAD(P)-dependent dehydrogenase (short-subunit alcohol dehydrogenase family)
MEHDHLKTRPQAEPKSAIVTGAGSGLGRALAVQLAKAGWRVALADIDPDSCQATLDHIQAAGGRGHCETLDVTSSDQWQALRDRLTQRWDHLDLLVNNAGVGCGGEVDELSLDDWRWTLDVNLCGPIHGCHTFIPWLKRNPRGASIVNIASVAAIASSPSMAPYNVTKAAVVSLSETLYNELRPHGVHVTVACPGFFRTNILASGRFARQRQREAAMTVMDRSRITADEVARRIVRAVERKQFYLFLPTIAWMLWCIKRLAPRSFLRLVGWLANRWQVRHAPNGRCVQPASENAVRIEEKV